MFEPSEFCLGVTRSNPGQWIILLYWIPWNMPPPLADILPVNGGCGVPVTLWTERYLVRISAATLAILIEVLWFYSTLQADVGIIRRLGHDSFASLPFEFVIHLSSRHSALYRVSQEESSVFWEVTVSAILSMYMYMCPIPSGFRARAISLYSSSSSSSTPCPHTSCKVHSYWRWNFQNV
jgi:hypothetical protein